MVWLVATILAWVTGSLVRLLEPLVTWIIVRVLGRIPRWPFLTTAIAIDALRPRALPERAPNNPWGALGKGSTSRSAPPPRSREPE